MYPKRGFTGPNLVDFDVVNVDKLAKFEAGSTVTPKEMVAFGFIKGNAPREDLGDRRTEGEAHCEGQCFFGFG
jgi:ribosomal protein L15